MPKRQSYNDWDATFMNIAQVASQRSKDPSCQNGVCIVHPTSKEILGVGYNGLPRGLRDDLDVIHTFQFPDHFDPWSDENKKLFVIHAEENAILNAKNGLNKTILYLFSEYGYFPCSKCAAIIIQKGISEIVIKSNNKHIKPKKNVEQYNFWASKALFEYSNVIVREI